MAASTALRAETRARLERARGAIDRRLVILAIAALLALAAGAVVVSRSSLFHARAIDVSGTEHLSRSRVIALAGVSTATNAIWLDEGVVERRLESDPWIADAEVRVDLPWTIRISVLERTPVAVATDGIRRLLVAADGTALGTTRRSLGLPRIEVVARGAAEGAPGSPRGAATAIGAMKPTLRARVTFVRVLLDGTLEIRLHGGVRVRYGAPSQIRRKAATLSRVLGWARTQGELVSIVNVVAPQSPAVRLAA